MNSQLILETLKNVLKQNKITYKELATKLGLSEAGIKKMFSSGDLNLSRLISICEIVGLSPKELMQASEKPPITKIRFNDTQSSFFTNKPDYFAFFLNLSSHRKSLEELSEDYNISPEATWKYLKKLDELQLIRLHEKNRIEHLYSLPLNIDPDGQAFIKLITKYAFNFIENVQRKRDKENHLNLNLFKLSEENFNKLIYDIETLKDSYQRQSEIDKALTNIHELKDISLLSVYGSFSFLPRPNEI